jgi:hypothetical protein
MTLQQVILNRLKAGALLSVVIESDEALAVEACRMAAEAIAPKQVQVVSVLDPEFGDKLQAHKDTGKGVMIIADLLRVQGTNPGMARLLREFALQVKQPPYPRIILVESAGTEVPAGLRGDIEYIITKLPTVEELKQELEQFIGDQNIKLAGNGEEKAGIAESLAGLARHEAAKLLARCWVDNKKLDQAWLRRAKAERVSERLGGALSFINCEDTPDIGGSELLQAWLGDRRKAFASEKARKYGLPESKGLLLVGVPGCGKSATVKDIAKDWGLPALRLDIGKVFGSLVGQSEAQIRQAIEAAEACAPCVLWVDEIEKGLSGNKGGGGGDSGTGARVFGAILTWLQEKTRPVFVVATANRVMDLPPELLRKGRFDEIFFVDLPDTDEREAIARIHVERRKRSLEVLDPKAISLICQDFSGAEIEQAIIDAMFKAYSEDREVTLEDIKTAAENTMPLSKTMAEDIKKLRDWAKGRARYANKKAAEAKAVEGGVKRAAITPDSDDKKGWKSSVDVK